VWDLKALLAKPNEKAPQEVLLSRGHNEFLAFGELRLADG